MPSLASFPSIKVPKLWNGKGIRKGHSDESDEAKERDYATLPDGSHQQRSPDQKILKDTGKESRKGEKENTFLKKLPRSLSHQNSKSLSTENDVIPFTSQRSPALSTRVSLGADKSPAMISQERDSFSRHRDNDAKYLLSAADNLPLNRGDSYSATPSADKSRLDIGNLKSSMSPIKSRLNAIGTSLSRSSTTQELYTLKDTDMNRSESSHQRKSSGKGWANELISRHRDGTKDREYFNVDGAEPDGLLSSHLQELSNESNFMLEYDRIITHHSPTGAIPNLPWRSDEREISEKEEVKIPVPEFTWKSLDNADGKEEEVNRQWEKFESRRDSMGIVGSQLTGNTQNSSANGNPFGTDGELSPASTGNYRSVSPVKKNRMGSMSEAWTDHSIDERNEEEHDPANGLLMTSQSGIVKKAFRQR